MDYQLYQVVLSPDLELTPEDFADAWNKTSASHDVTEAQVSAVKGTQFDAALVATILLSIPLNLASSALYDLIKKVIQQAHDRHNTPSQSPSQPHRRIHIEQREKPGGTRYLVVDIDEE